MFVPVVTSNNQRIIINTNNICTLSKTWIDGYHYLTVKMNNGEQHIIHPDKEQSLINKLTECSYIESLKVEEAKKSLREDFDLFCIY
ncbi:MAG: hypothetical protein MJZ03_00660 [archaeon]|nr:hypothetical protein [archaeon]